MLDRKEREIKTSDCLVIFKMHTPGETIQKLKALTVLPEDEGSILTSA